MKERKRGQIDGIYMIERYLLNDEGAISTHQHQWIKSIDCLTSFLINPGPTTFIFRMESLPLCRKGRGSCDLVSDQSDQYGVSDWPRSNNLVAL